MSAQCPQRSCHTSVSTKCVHKVCPRSVPTEPFKRVSLGCVYKVPTTCEGGNFLHPQSVLTECAYKVLTEWVPAECIHFVCVCVHRLRPEGACRGCADRVCPLTVSTKRVHKAYTECVRRVCVHRVIPESVSTKCVHRVRVPTQCINKSRPQTTSTKCVH